MCAVLLAFSTVTALWTVQAQATVALTKHNLSTTGPGTIKSAEAEVCVFCHTPHNSRIDPTGSLPLWNRKASTATYLPYTSTTTKATIGAPTGSSLLCLSCHDGTIALGELLSRGASRVALSGVDASGFITGPGKLGADLRDDHPISFKYDAALVALRGELANPNSLPAKVKLDANGQMQCATCHDAHDDTNGKFLVIPNTSSALCTTCHTKTNWVSSSHATSASTWNGLNLTLRLVGNGWLTVRQKRPLATTAITGTWRPALRTFRSKWPNRLHILWPLLPERMIHQNPS